MNKAKLVLTALLAWFAAGADAAAITVASPQNGQVFNVGDRITFEYSADVNMTSTNITTLVNNSVIYLANQNLDPPRNRYRYTVDTVGLPAGERRIMVNAMYPYGSTGSASVGSDVYIVLQDTNNGDNNAVVVRRTLPRTVSAGGYASVVLGLLPRRSFPGIITRETLPTGLIVAGVPNSQIAEVTYNIIGMQLKIVGRNANNIGAGSIRYSVRLPQDLQSGTVLRWDGNWAIEGEEGVTVGDTYTTIGGFVVPECPLSDEQLLRFIGQWATSEIDNSQILQVIERWRSC